MVLLLIACPGPVLVEPEPPWSGPTTIESVTHGCDVEDDTWSFEVRTQGWTGGARIALSEDGLAMEEHTLLSAEADPDGEWDRLTLKLSIVADPDDQRRDESTRYLCVDGDNAALGALLQVMDPDSGSVADCRWWGVEQDWSALGGYAPCERPLD